MRNYSLKITLCLFLFFSLHNLSAQKQSINDYIGTWRWVSGNKDTFLIVLMPDKKEKVAKNGEPVNVIGYHTYIEKGQLVESNVHEIGGKDTSIFSILGYIEDNKLIIGIFWDFTRNRKLRGDFQPLKEFPGKGIWNLPIFYEHYVFYGVGMREYPPGRTVPNNIVLEKIN